MIAYGAPVEGALPLECGADVRYLGVSALHSLTVPGLRKCARSLRGLRATADIT
jgi:hypothetical protein